MSRSRFSKLVSVVITGVIAISGLPSMVLADVINSPTYYSVQSELDYEITTNITSSWINHENIDLVLTNTGIDTIHNWYLTFNTPYSIDNIWNGAIYETDGNGTYTITSNGWNQDIHVGESVTVGITFSSDTETEFSVDPTWYLLNTQATVVDASQYTLEYTEYSAWETGFTGQLTLTPQVDCQHWELSFSSNREITAASSAVLIPEGDSNYAITHDENNMRLFAGTAYNFGIQGVNTEEPLDLSNVELTAVDLAYHLTDDADANGVPDYHEFIGGGSLIDPTPTPTPIPTGAPSITPTIDPNPTQYIVQYPIMDFYVSKPELNVGDTDNRVYFYAMSDIITDEIIVYDEAGNVITVLYDNGNYGNNGDDIRGDGLYSGILLVNTTAPSETNYHIQIEYDYTIYTASTSISVIPLFTDLNNDELNSVLELIRELKRTDAFITSDILQRKDLLLNLLLDISINGTDEYEYELIDSSTITYDEIGEMITFSMYFGCPVAIDLNLYSDLYANTPETGSSITHIEGSYESDVLILYGVNNIYVEGTPTDVMEGYENIVDEIEDLGYSATVDYNFTVNDLRTILDDRIAIVFATHGSVNSDGLSMISTIEDNSITDFWINNDINKGRIIRTESGYLVTSNFFPFYWENKLDNTLMLFSSCRSAGTDDNPNTSFGDALAECGAIATIGMRENVYVRYPMNLYEVLLMNYLEHETVGTSFDNAVRDVGANDIIWFENEGNTSTKSVAATPHIIGGNIDYYIPWNSVENGSFNNPFPSLSNWRTSGDVRAIMRLGNIRPTDGIAMAILTTGVGSGEMRYLNGNNESSMRQYFWIRSEDSIVLSFDYNFISEEPTEFLGSRFDDAFVVYVVTQSDSNHISNTLVCSNSVNNADWTRINSVDFYGGDSTCYETGWYHVDIDLSDYQHIWGIIIAVTDVGDSAFDSAVLIDDVRINY